MRPRLAVVYAGATRGDMGFIDTRSQSAYGQGTGKVLAVGGPCAPSTRRVDTARAIGVDDAGSGGRYWNEIAMVKLRALLMTLLGVTFVAACGGGGDAAPSQFGSGPVRVAASMSVFADLVRQVGGDRVTVLSLIPAGADAHTYQPSPKAVQRLGDVRAIFINGSGLEESLLPVLENNAPAGARLVDLSAGLQSIEVEEREVGPAGEEEEEHEEGNPHFWLDVAYAKEYVARIREALSEVDPEGRAGYAANAQRYLAELDQTDAYIRTQIATIPPAQRKLVTFHDAFPYFARAYGLELAGFVVRAPGREPSARDIKELGEVLQSEGVKTVFKEPQLNAKLLDRAAKDAGVKVGVLYSDALTGEITSYVAMMRRNADAVAEGLR